MALPALADLEQVLDCRMDRDVEIFSVASGSRYPEWLGRARFSPCHLPFFPDRTKNPANLRSPRRSDLCHYDGKTTSIMAFMHPLRYYLIDAARYWPRARKFLIERDTWRTSDRWSE